jgi:glycosyltransferase involved in cell wall biosynthesis
MTRRPVLFVSHDASRTGAPILLLHFLRWLKNNSELPFRVLLREGGPLTSEFKAVAQVTLLTDWKAGVPGIPARMQRRWTLRRLARRAGLIYCNTITNGLIMPQLAASNQAIVTHVHELETTIRNYGVENFRNVTRHSRGYVACSEAVKTNLVKSHSIREDRVDVIHEFVDASALSLSTSRSAHSTLRREIGVPDRALIVAGAGLTSWRKAPDLFVLLARAVVTAANELPVHFVWIGGAAPGSRSHNELLHDLQRLGLTGRVHFLGPRTNVIEQFSAIDVFAMVSREDPFPLVCLEAASTGAPIVCFDDAGGTKEFVERDCGFIAPYMDVDAMAGHVLSLLRSEQLRQQLGLRAAEKVRERHTISVAAPKLLKVIERQLRHNSAS